MKCFKVTGGDCFAISLVEDPAIDSSFIALSKDYKLMLENEKHIITGAVLIPNKPIYRRLDGREFYISFDEPTIQALALNFINNEHNVTIAHREETLDVEVIESWVKSSEVDKSVSLGINEPIGTWFVSMKVNNEEIWKDIKDGKYKGFSIEAIVGLDEQLGIDMEKELKEQIMDLINEALGKKAEEVKAEETPAPEEMKAKDEEIAKLKEDVANLSAEVERLKAERDELESKLKDEVAAKEAMNVEMESIKAENVKLSAQPSVKPQKNEVNLEGSKNFGAAVKLQLK